jgi:hypothetical protein
MSYKELRQRVEDIQSQLTPTFRPLSRFHRSTTLKGIDERKTPSSIRRRVFLVGRAREGKS